MIWIRFTIFDLLTQRRRGSRANRSPSKQKEGVWGSCYGCGEKVEARQKPKKLKNGNKQRERRQRKRKKTDRTNERAQSLGHRAKIPVVFLLWWLMIDAIIKGYVMCYVPTLGIWIASRCFFSFHFSLSLLSYFLFSGSNGQPTTSHTTSRRFTNTDSETTPTTHNVQHNYTCIKHPYNGPTNQ